MVLSEADRALILKKRHYVHSKQRKSQLNFDFLKRVPKRLQVLVSFPTECVVPQEVAVPFPTSVELSNISVILKVAIVDVFALR